MGEPFVVPKKSGTMHREPLKIKNCAYPGCKIKQAMTGKGIYCTEHRQRKYRKIIDADKIVAKKAEEEAHNPNQTIKHAYTNTVILMMQCQLEGCHKEFEVKIFPSVYVYPKFCPCHRNEFQRNLFIKKRKEEND